MAQPIAAAMAALLAATLLAGCSPADTDPGPGGVTVGEAKALDEAAAMLDERRLPEDALNENAIGETDPAASRE